MWANGEHGCEESRPRLLDGAARGDRGGCRVSRLTSTACQGYWSPVIRQLANR